jgi:hypothetical protein
MAMIHRLLARVVVVASFALSAGSTSAQNAMHLRIDTVIANPGATVDVRVLYTFTSTHAHDIHDFNARFLFDTSESQLVAYVMAGTASAALTDTTGSHVGLLALAEPGTEINLADSVLFIVRMTIDSTADTAWIRWDPNWYHGDGLAVFSAGDEGIDSVTLEDGWIRTPKSNAIVQVASSALELPRVYPNPAYDRVTINPSGSTAGETLQVFNAVGRLAFTGPLVLGAWQIPPEFEAGAYEIIVFDVNQRPQYIGTLIVAPR